MLENTQKTDSIEEYKNSRKNYRYYKILKKIIKVFSNEEKSILDIGSSEIDLMSEFPFKKRVSVSIHHPLNNKKVQGIEMDFFDYKAEEKFDVVSCCQVIEHVEEAKKFTQKVLDTGHTIILSVPYKWRKGACQWHVQDPIDEEKLFKFTNKKPDFEFFAKDGRWRAIYIYGEISKIQKLKLWLISLECKFYNAFVLRELP